MHQFFEETNTASETWKSKIKNLNILQNSIHKSGPNIMQVT